MSSLRVVILGGDKVGKSAVTVRFLTKRFIGEYNSDIDLLYRSSIKQEDYVTDIEILDTCTKRPPTSPATMDSLVQWADAFVVVYSVCDKASFMQARLLLQSLHSLKTPCFVPILLLGNMIDLEHRREVGLDEGHELGFEHSCQFYEVSAAEQYMAISIAFQALLRDAKLVQQQRSTLLKRRRSSLLNMSRKIGAILKKRDSDLDKKRPSCDASSLTMSF